jgi:hypothetical protein
LGGFFVGHSQGDLEGSSPCAGVVMATSLERLRKMVDQQAKRIGALKIALNQLEIDSVEIMAEDGSSWIASSDIAWAAARKVLKEANGVQE